MESNIDTYREFPLPLTKTRRIKHGTWNTFNNRVLYLKWLMVRNGWTEPKDLYNITSNIILENYGRGLLAKYDGSPYKLVCELGREVFPEHEFLPFKFIGQTPKNWWSKIDNRLYWFKWLMQENNLEKPEDLYNITADIILKNYGSGILGHYYNGSPYDMVCELGRKIFPEHEFWAFKFDFTQIGWWDDPKNQLLWFKWFMQENNLEKPEDLYNITSNIILKNYGSGLLAKYDGSPYKLVRELGREVFPNHVFLPFKFGQTPKNWWFKIDNRLYWFKWLMQENNWKKPEDLYNITADIITSNHGSGILGNYYNGSPYEMVLELGREVFPEHEFLAFKFGMTQMGWWDDPKNQLLWFRWFMQENNLEKPEDLYKITKKIIESNYGAMLLNKYHNSPYKLVCEMGHKVFPEHEFWAFKFTQTTKNWWDDPKNQLLWFKWFMQENNLEKPEDLYKITGDILSSNHGTMLLIKYNKSPYKLVCELGRKVFPEHEFLAFKFAQTPIGWWDDPKNQLRWFRWFIKQNNLEKPEHLYKIELKKIIYYYGGGLVAHYYNNSPCKLVSELGAYIFPDFVFDYKKYQTKLEWKCMEYFEQNFPGLIFGKPLNQKCVERLSGKKYRLDGYHEETNTAVEFHGDIWHGNPKKLNMNDINPVTKEKYGVLFCRTVSKELELRFLGYNYCCIWEDDWNTGNKILNYGHKIPKFI